MNAFKAKNIPTCFICGLTFTSRNVFNYRGVERRPLVISCGHSVCEPCILKSIKAPGDTLKCYKCNTLTVASEKYSDKKPHLEFPVNHFLLGLAVSCAVKSNDAQISFARSKTNKPPSHKNVTCNECVEKKADVKCIQCSAPYCKYCFDKVHGIARAFRSHVFTDLDSCDDTDLCVSTLCLSHRGVPQQFWCDDCNNAICSRCLTELHNGHRISILSEKNNELFLSLFEALTSVVNLQQRLKATKKKAAIGLNDVASNEVLKAEEEILDHFGRLHGALLFRQNALINQLYSPCTGTANSLNDIVNQMDKYLEEVDKVVNTSQTIMKNKKKYLENVSYSEILEKLKTLESIPCHLLISDNKDTTRLIEDPSIFDVINSHCSLEMSESKPKYCLVPTSELPENYTVDPIPEVKLGSLLAQDKFGSYPNSLRSGSSLSSSNTSLNSSCLSLPEQIPPSLPEERTVENINFEELVPGCSVKVSLVYATSPSDFYVHRLGASRQLSEMEIKVARYLKISKILNDYVQIGGVYLVQYEQDKKWYRAKVISKHDDNYNVFFLDYGNSSIVTIDKFRTLPPNLIDMHGLAVHCCLNNCVPNGKEWDPQALPAMLQIIRDSVISMTVRRKGSSILYVDLYKVDSLQGNISVQEALLFLGLAYMKGPDVNTKASPPVLMKNTPPPIKQDVGEVLDVEISHFVSPSEIYIQNMKNYDSLMVLMKGLLDFYSMKKNDKMVVFAPKKGMLVAAMFSGDNQWYRARIIDVPHNKQVTVKYIDFGNTEIISWKRIRSLASRFFSTSEQCYRCSLADIKTAQSEGWSSKACELINSFTFDPKVNKVNLKAVIHSTSDSVYNIVLYRVDDHKSISLNAFLVNHGVAVSTGANSAILEFNNKMFENFSETDRGSSTRSKVSAAKSEDSVNSASTEELNSQKTTSSSIDSSAKSSRVADSNGNPHSSSSRDKFKVPVEVVKVISPSEFYITIAHRVKDLNNMRREMNDFYNKNYESYHLENVSTGMHCVVKKLAPGDWVANIATEVKWVRGIAVEVNENNSLVYLLDLGDTIEVHNDEIYQLLAEFMQVPDGVTRCHLGGLKKPFDDQEWPLSSTGEFKEFVDKHSGQIHVTALGENLEGCKSMAVEVLLKEEKDAGPWEPAIVRWTSFNNLLRKMGLALTDNTVEWDIEAAYDEVKKQEPRHNADFTKGLPMKYAGLAVNPQEVEEAMPEFPVGSEALFAHSINGGRLPHVDLLSQSDQCSPQVPDVLPLVPPEMPSQWLPPLPFPNLEFIANITNVDDKCSFFIQDFTSTVKSLKDISFLLEAHCKMSLPMPHDLYWSPGQTCLCQYHGDKNWYRGVVQQVNGNDVMVLFVDYGNIEECGVKDLRKISLAADIPIQGQFCFMKKIKTVDKSGKWPTPDLDHIHSLVVEKHCLVKLEPLPNNEGYYLESVLLPNGSDLFELLEKDGIAEYTEKKIRITKEEVFSAINAKEDPKGSLDGLSDDLVVESEVPVVRKQPQHVPVATKSPREGPEPSDEASDTSDDGAYSCYDVLDMSPCEPIFQEVASEYRPLVIPENLTKFEVEVVFVMSPDTVVFQIVDAADLLLIEERKTFIEVMNTMQSEAFKQPKVSDPCINMLCCALFKGVWYRALIKEVLPNEMVKVKYIDFGNDEVLSINELRELDDLWSDFGSQCIEAKLYNVVACDPPETVVNSLMVHLLDRPCTAIIKERSPELSVELYRGVTLAYQELIDSKLVILAD